MDLPRRSNHEKGEKAIQYQPYIKAHQFLSDTVRFYYFYTEGQYLQISTINLVCNGEVISGLGHQGLGPCE